MNFSYTIEHHPNYCILHCKGRLTDPQTIETVLQHLEQEMDCTSWNLILNLHNLEYINSSGLQLFLSLLRKCRKESGELVLIQVPDRIKDLFIITKLNAIFKSFNTVPSALNELGITDV